MILSTARSDERIRAVMLNGSRANPSAPRDIFQDFDIVYLVTELESFKADPSWINRFGERMVMQLPSEFADVPPDIYAYLLQFSDGNRIDLTLKTGGFSPDSQSILLLDKNAVIAPLPPPSDADYLPKPPTAKAFLNCCNEFWWVCPYVAKGLWREEFTYARYHLDTVLRDQLMQMLDWYVGIRTGFQKSPGKSGKYLQQHLPPPQWEQLLQTYAGASYEQTWDSLLAMTELFRAVAQEVAAHFGFEYPYRDDERVSAHLKHVRHLPKDATAIY